MLLILKEPRSYRIKSFLSSPIKKKKRKEPFLGWLHGLVTAAGAEGFSLRRAPCWVLLLPSWNSQKFYLWTCKLSWKESEAHVWTEVRCPTCIHPLSLQHHSIHIVFTVPGEHRIPVDSWLWGFNETESKHKVSVLHLWLIGRGDDSPQEPGFPWNAKRWQWHSKKHKGPTKSIIPFLICVCLVFFLYNYSKSHRLKMMAWKERER